MDITAIKTTEEFLKESKNNSALIYLNTGQSYETKFIYKIVEPSVGHFQPLIIIDVLLEQDDLAIIPIANIHHIVIKGPEKDHKVGFFIEKTQ
ncbi:MAG: hypothetical protein JSW40_02225 [Candidatus Omnitrophota bacterium]|nr:MAG: hypothetical protein JSW40_02225 [Candidatus Omnitrophota bacterium]